MEEEFNDFDRRNAWNSVYQEIRNESNNYSYTYKEAKKIENKNLNRYRDVNPFDHSRVCLHRGDKDYINASLVEVPSANRTYILTQGPLPSTCGHFWLMIWEKESKAILMLNRVIEKNAVKCHQYWPMGAANGGEDELVLNEVGLMVTHLSSTKSTNYIVREFTLTDFQSGQSRTVLQFHYTTWPDFGVPDSPSAFLSFLSAVRNSGGLNEDAGPAVIHCSAGIGRSGTFCLVDSCLVLIEKTGDMNTVNIRELLMDMRRYRMGLIQTPDQLRFSYMAIIEGSRRILSNENLVPSELNDIENNSLLNHKEDSDSYSESSADEGIETAGTSNSTPPPLPPRPPRINDLSPTTPNSDLSLLSADSIESNLNSSILSNCNRDKNINEPCETSTSGDKANHCTQGSPTTADVAHQAGLVNSASTDTAEDAESAAELRKRKRKERSEKTAAIVQKIKKKQKETELWQKRRSILKRISVGLALLFGTGVLVYRYYSRT